MRRHLDLVGASVPAEGHEEEEKFADYIAFGVLVLAMALGILTRLTLAKWLPIPYTVLLLLWGGLFGAIHTGVSDPFNPALDNGIDAWLSMDPRVLQIVFFPILIFASAFNAPFHILERRLGQIMFLALPGVLLGAGLTATFMKLVLPYNWDWNLCLVFGSMVAATDPVAVVALLEELGVSEKLGTLIEGESLLNDGSAIVVFEVFLEAVEGKSRSFGEVIEFGARLALGGPIIGVTIGLMGAFALGYVINDALVEVSMTVLLAYCTFALCESTEIKVSGVLGIVACGVVLSYYGKPRVSSPVLPSLLDFWKTLQFFADTTIFFLSGLIVIGVAMNEDRAISAADFGYLLLLFMALYVIRGIVVLSAYPILRTGEYRITVPQMMVLTHSGLRGAVALILALVVDGVHVIAQNERDKIVFLTAGVAVLSLLVNGTTTGPLVRFLKLDRASEASVSVFGNACFALELSMQKQEDILKEDPFLGDANWSLVWRYLPIFTPETYWHRLSKSRISLSAEEVEDIRAANDRAQRRTGKRTVFQVFADWLRSQKGGFSYSAIPHRLRIPWYDYHTRFLFEDSGGEEMWGDLDSFLANNTASDDSTEAWSGHLKHSHFDKTVTGKHQKSSPGETRTGKSSRSSSRNSSRHSSKNSSRMSSLRGAESGDGTSKKRRGAEEEKTPGDSVGASDLAFSSEQDLSNAPKSQASGKAGALEKEINVDTSGAMNAPTAAVKKAQVESSGIQGHGLSSSVPPQEGLHIGEEDAYSSDGSDSEEDERRRSLSKRVFKRAVSMARKAGVSVNFTEKREKGITDKSELLEARRRFLAALKAEYFKAKREGKLGSSGLRVLTEAINNTHDKVEKGSGLEGWSELSGHFTKGWQMHVAKAMNWWPARPVAAAAIARRVSFQMELAWNFLEAHHESNLKSLLEDNGQISLVQRQVNYENQKQIDAVEDCISRLAVEAPMVTRSVKTRVAALVMVRRFREATELLAENGHLDEKEEEVLKHAVTDAEMRVAYHPNLEQLPPLSRVLEKIEFLNELSSDERQKLMDVGACYFNEYVGEVRLMQMGKIGARGTKKNPTKDFCGWFYVVRGQVEKCSRVDDNRTEGVTYSSGLLFGITDAMLEIPHHAGYLTHGFSNLVVFDRQKLLEEAKTMPNLDRSLWQSTAAHCLRRSIRFHRFKLRSCHSLLDGATFLNGKEGPDGESEFAIAGDDAIILVRGKILSVEGDIDASALGQADTTKAPVMLEPFGQADKGGSVKISGDYKAFKLPCDMLTNFAKDERDRMERQDTKKRASMTLNALKPTSGSDDDGEDTSAGRPNLGSAHSQDQRHVMEEEMAAKLNLHPRTATIGAKAAMKLMAGIKQHKTNDSDCEDDFKGQEQQVEAQKSFGMGKE